MAINLEDIGAGMMGCRHTSHAMVCGRSIAAGNLRKNLQPALSPEMNHTLEVVRLWEQVDQLYLLDPITAAKENDKIAGQGRRIA